MTTVGGLVTADVEDRVLFGVVLWLDQIRNYRLRESILKEIVGKLMCEVIGNAPIL